MKGLIMGAAFVVHRTPKYNGYTDREGRFVPFIRANEVFVRARSLGGRVLLRLTLDDNDNLHGNFVSNATGLSTR